MYECVPDVNHFYILDFGFEILDTAALLSSTHFQHYRGTWEGRGPERGRMGEGIEWERI
jgi:hypothetical protein